MSSTVHTLTIRYADPSTTPARHLARGYGADVPTVQTELDRGYWQLTSGERYALTAHVQRALSANDLNDYRLS